MGLLHYYLREAHTGAVQLEISDINGTRKRVMDVPAEAGVHRVYWDLRLEEPRRDPQSRSRVRSAQVTAGLYRLKLTVAGEEYFGEVTVREDPLSMHHE